MSIEYRYGDMVRLILERMTALNITQTKLASMVGVSPAAISQILNRKKYPQILTFLNILENLGVILGYEIRMEIKGKSKRRIK